MANKKINKTNTLEKCKRTLLRLKEEYIKSNNSEGTNLVNEALNGIETLFNLNNDEKSKT